MILLQGNLSQQIFKCRFWESFLEGNWYNLSYFLRCRFSPVFIGLIVEDSENSLKNEPIMGSSSSLPDVATEDDEVSWWDRKQAAKSVSL